MSTYKDCYLAELKGGESCFAFVNHFLLPQSLDMVIPCQVFSLLALLQSLTPTANLFTTTTTSKAVTISPTLAN